MPAELHPPLAASDFWVVGAVFAFLIAVLLGFLPLMRRLRRSRNVVGPVPEHVRHRFSGLLDEIERRTATGALSSRAAAQELSALLRDFAAAAWGLRTEHMTARDMRERGLGPLSDAVARLYAAEFGSEEPPDVEEEVRMAREVITRW